MPVPTAGSPPASRRHWAPLVGAASQVMLLFVMSRLTGLARDIVIVATFGLSEPLDAYQAAFRIPDMIFEVVAGGALGSAFLPTFTRYLRRSGEASAWRLFSQAVNAVTFILTLFAGACIFTAPWLVRVLLAPGFAPAQQLLVANLMRWLLLATVIYGASGLCMAALNTKRHFSLPALAPSLRNGAIIASALFLAEPWGVYGLAAGAVGGAVLHLAVQLPAAVRHGLRYELILHWRDPGLVHVMKLMLPRMVGLLFIHLNFIVNTYLASQLAPGSVSALEYGFRIMLLPVALFGQALAIAAFPTFSAQVEARNWPAIKDTFSRAVRLVTFLAAPSTAGFYLLRMPLVQTLYQRGSFTAESAERVAYALQFFLIGLLAYAVVEIAVRAFYAFHDTRTPVAAGVLIAGLNVGLSVWWVRYLGFGGLALANSVATTLEMGLLLVWLKRKIPDLDWSQLMGNGWQVALATLGMGLLVWRYVEWATVRTQALASGPYLVLAGGLLIAAATYLLLSRLLGNQDWRFLWRRPTTSA